MRGDFIENPRPTEETDSPVLKTVLEGPDCTHEITVTGNTLDSLTGNVELLYHLIDKPTIKGPCNTPLSLGISLAACQDQIELNSRI